MQKALIRGLKVLNSFITVDNTEPYLATSMIWSNDQSHHHLVPYYTACIGNTILCSCIAFSKVTLHPAPLTTIVGRDDSQNSSFNKWQPW